MLPVRFPHSILTIGSDKGGSPQAVKSVAKAADKKAKEQGFSLPNPFAK